MAQRKARNAERTPTTKVPTKVNLYCNECNTQLSIFNNEWIHLTPSYAAPKETGKNFGTRIGNTTKKVPDGVVHKMAAGCEMAEIFCESCNMHIGQHCESAPHSKQSQMVGQHFYKLTKTYLKCAKTAKAIDPVFVDGEDFAPSTPKRQATKTKESSPEARRKSTPPPQKAVNQNEQHDGSARTLSRDSDTGVQNVLVRRLADLERLVRSSSFAAPTNPARPEPYGPPTQPYSYSFPAPAPSNPQHDQIVDDQRKQITSLTAQVDSLRGTIDDLRGVIQDLRAEKARQQSVSLQESAVMSRFDEMIRSVRDGQKSAAETEVLRAENEKLNERLSTIAGATRADGSEEDVRALSTLGKRKRDDGYVGRASFRSSDALGQNGGYSGANHHDHFQPPSPDSLQEPMNIRGSTPAMHPFPQHQPSYRAPPLRHQYSDPGMAHYPTPGPNHGTPHPPENTYANPMDRVARQEGVHPTRSESRLDRRAATTQGGRRTRRRRSDDDYAVGDNVEFSDDEIATPAPGDAPLSVPRKRPQPRTFYQQGDPPPSHRGSRLGSTMATPAPPGAYQDPFEGRAPLQAPAQPQVYHPPPFPRPGTCKSLRQPAEAPGIAFAVNFTPEEVAKRVVRKKKAAPGVASSGKPRSSSNAIAEPKPIDIPIDPALEHFASRGNSSGSADNGAGDSTEDENEVLLKPTRSSTRNKKDSHTSSVQDG